METSMEVLVVILSGVLAINLVLGFIALIKLIRVINQIKQIVDKAEDLTDKVEAISEFVRNNTFAAVIGKLIANFAGQFKKRRAKSRKEDFDDE